MKYKLEKEWIPKSNFDMYVSSQDKKKQRKKVLERFKKKSSFTFVKIWNDYLNASHREIVIDKYYSYNLSGIEKETDRDVIIKRLSYSNIFSEIEFKAIKRKIFINKLMA